MAYFSNGTEGDVFTAQCGICKYGQEPCPIALIQMTYNYDQIGNDLARKIINDLVEEDGTCTMFKTFENDFTNEHSADWPKIETVADKMKQDYVRENWERITL